MSAFSEEQISELKTIFGSATPVPQDTPPTPEEEAARRVSQVGKPDVDPEGGPEYWIHLADGTPVFKSFDSSSSHVNGVLVIGRYQVGE